MSNLFDLSKPGLGAQQNLECLACNVQGLHLG